MTIMPVFILMMHVKPNDDHPQLSAIAGAYVNCFVEAESFDVAEETALMFLKSHYWIPIALEEGYGVTEDDYVGDPDGLAVYKQVLIDKELYTIHTYDTEGD
jgi:hypothetical protein